MFPDAAGRTRYPRHMSFTLRRPTAADAASLGRVHVEAWRWAYRGQMADDLLDSLRPESRAKAWSAWLTNDSESDFNAWAAEVDGEIIGFAASTKARDEDAPDRCVELTAIYLLEEYLGLGIGHALITEAEQQWRASGYDVAVLWVLESNEGTRRFYEQHGWVADGARRVQDRGAVGRPVVRYTKLLE